MNGTDVKNARNMSGLRLGAFAQAIGVSLATLDDMEGGKQQVHPAMVARIETVVDAELFKDSDPSPGEQQSVDLDEIPSIDRPIYSN